MIDLATYLSGLSSALPELVSRSPWSIPASLSAVLIEKINSLSGDFKTDHGVAIHKTATIEVGAVLKGPLIISANCFVGAHAYLRGGVFLGDGVSVGPGCEIKSSVVLAGSALAHFNFVGDSLIGSDVNMEAGSVIANHYNERRDKTISVIIDDVRTSIGVRKFGAIVGDGCRIGANAVLSPGTVLAPRRIVRRLELVEQCPQ